MKLIPQKIPDSKWLKAAVIASYWAAIEIVIGSFLHNLRFPMSGTVLSFNSVFLLVSFNNHWKQSGLIWRAGLICALMKSISPSAVILGPMIGIFSEALLLEFFIWIFGRNLLGYILGGAFAVLSALLHKAVSLLIMYGWNLLKILSALYVFSVRQLGFQGLDPKLLVLIITVLYLLTGMVAAVAGYVASSSRKRNLKQEEPLPFSLSGNDGPLYPESSQKYSVWLIGLNAMVMILLMLLISQNHFLVAIPLSLAYFLFVALRYHPAMRHLKKPSFWLQFIGITLVASLLLNSISTGVLFSLDGLIIGLSMNFRAVIVLMGFAAVSAELKNPVIRAISYRRGMAGFYQSLGLAFSALPSAFQAMPDRRTLARKPGASIRRLLAFSDDMLIAFGNRLQSRPDIIIVTGERQQGKTSFVRMMLNSLDDQNIKVSGFLAIGIHEDSRRTGFDLLDIQTGIQTELCREQLKSPGLTYGRFSFSAEALDRGIDILSPMKTGGSQLVVIDEVGPLEMKNKGWAPAIRKLVFSCNALQLWVVRKNLVNEVVSSWPVGDVYVFDCLTDSPEETAAFIRNRLVIRQS